MARIANSLATLRSQVDAAFPIRSKENDGWIGDAAHAARKSDHNPNEHGVVQALDITHDPKHGFDSYKFADALCKLHDPRIKYIISNRRIAELPSLRWQQYYGSNPHDQHVHISVSDNPAKYDDASLWRVLGSSPSMEVAAPAPPTTSTSRTPRYRSLVGGFFSDPNALGSKHPTSVRYNNPGAINGADWEKSLPGYVDTIITSYSVVNGERVPNKTTIFETPEYGIAAYYELLRRYRNLFGVTTVRGIIKRYGGGQDYSDYEKFVSARTGLPASYDIKLSGDDPNLLKFSKAMLRYEAGRTMPDLYAVPWSDEQIMYGINLGRGTPVGSPPASVPAPGTVTSPIPKKPATEPVAKPSPPTSGLAAWVELFVKLFSRR